MLEASNNKGCEKSWEKLTWGLYDDDSKKRTLKYTYLIILSACVSGTSLLGDSQEGVIGSMLIAPLSQPILDFFTVVKPTETTMPDVQKYRVNIVLTFVFGALLCVGIGWALGKLFKLLGDSFPILNLKLYDEKTDTFISSEIEKRSKLSSAMFSGFAAFFISIAFFYHHYHADQNQMIGVSVGCGIAISLVPPLVTIGIILSCLNNKGFDKWTKPFLIFGINSGTFILVGLIFYCTCIVMKKKS